RCRGGGGGTRGGARRPVVRTLGARRGGPGRGRLRRRRRSGRGRPRRGLPVAPVVARTAHGRVDGPPEQGPGHERGDRHGQGAPPGVRRRGRIEIGTGVRHGATLTATGRRHGLITRRRDGRRTTGRATRVLTPRPRHAPAASRPVRVRCPARYGAAPAGSPSPRPP